MDEKAATNLSFHFTPSTIYEEEQKGHWWVYLALIVLSVLFALSFTPPWSSTHGASSVAAAKKKKTLHNPPPARAECGKSPES